MGLLINWLLVAAGLLATDMFSGLVNDTLAGGGDTDTLFGGAGADNSRLIQTDCAVAQITDFDPAEDDVTIYVDGLNTTEEAPVVSYATDTDSGTTTVSFDGEAALVFEGLFTEDELTVVLADVEDIHLGQVS